MLRNYLVIAWRNLARQKGYAFINGAGLAVGMAACLLIGLFVRDELSFDRFHEHAERIFLVAQEHRFGGREERRMSTPLPLGPAMRAEIPGVEEEVVQTYAGPGRVSRDGSDGPAGQERVIHATPGFFRVFTFPLVRGDAAEVLRKPNSVVITEALARKYFGEEDPVGQTLRIDRYEDFLYTVTGVAAPPPGPSSGYLEFDAVASIGTLERTNLGRGWGGSMYLTYVRLAHPGTAPGVEAALPELVRRHTEGKREARFFLVGLPDVYLSGLGHTSGFKGQPRFLYLFSAIALFILLLAGINYVNLATARAARRAREVGMRKTLGARRGQIACQFLAESALTSLIAFLFGMALARLALPVFNDAFEKELTLSLGGRALLGFAGLALLVGLLAGSYPAVYLSGLRPVRIFRGASRRSPSGARLRRALVVFQFAVAVVLLVGTAVVYRQLHYMQTKELGFREEQVLIVPLASDRLSAAHEAAKQAFLQAPGVLRAAAASEWPGQFGIRYGFAPDSSRPDDQLVMNLLNADQDFLETLGIRLAAGRNFSADRPADLTRSYLLNEAAVRALGWEAPVGRTLFGGTVIGVVRDFHFSSFRERIGPLIIRMTDPGVTWPPYSAILLRVRPGEVPAALAALRKQWARLEPDQPFEYRFLDEEFAALYRTDRRIGQVFGVFAVVAVVIACLGLFGLAAFAAEQRTKEIGIRKVQGASTADIVRLLSKDFLLLVLAAFTFAVPPAYWLMQRWLEPFAYRITLGAGVFLLAGAAAFAVALLAVGYQSLRAALADPVDALRSE